MSTEKIHKGNPMGSPLLGEEVDVKDYSTNVVQPKPVESTTENLPPPPEQNATEPVEEQTQTESQKPLDDFGTNYSGDEIDDYSKSNTFNAESEGTADQEQKQSFQVPAVDAKLFSKILVGGVKNYVPGLFVGISNRVSKVKKSDIDYHVSTKRLPAEFIQYYKKSKQELKEELQITDEEAQLLQEALEAYLQYKNIETANPANAFFLQATMITLRLTITSIKRGAEERAYWDQIFKKYDISDYKKHEYVVKTKDETVK